MYAVDSDLACLALGRRVAKLLEALVFDAAR